MGWEQSGADVYQVILPQRIHIHSYLINHTKKPDLFQIIENCLVVSLYNNDLFLKQRNNKKKKITIKQRKLV